MPEGEPRPSAENAPKPNPAPSEVTQSSVPESHIAGPKDVEKIQEERRERYSKVMDEMERQTVPDGHFFARFGVREGGFSGRRDTRALILTEPIATQTVRKGPLWKQTIVDQRTYIVMTNDGPKTITFEERPNQPRQLQEEFLKEAIADRVATCVENSIQLSELDPKKRVMTTNELKEEAARRLRAETASQGVLNFRNLREITKPLTSEQLEETMRRETEAYDAKQEVENAERKSADEGFFSGDRYAFIEIQGPFSREPFIIQLDGSPLTKFEETDPEEINKLVSGAIAKSKEAARNRHTPERDLAKLRLSRAEELLELIKSSGTPPPSSSQPPGSPVSAA